MISHDIAPINNPKKGGVDITQCHLLCGTRGLSPLSLGGKLHLCILASYPGQAPGYEATMYLYMFSQMCENGITAVSSVHWHSPNYLLAPKWKDDTTTDPQMCYTLLSIPCMCNCALGYNFVCAKSQELIHIQYGRLMPPLLRTMRANQNATYCLLVNYLR